MNDVEGHLTKLPHVTVKTIRTAAEERGRQEKWTLPLTALGNHFPSRLARLIDAADRRIPETSETSRKVRNLALRTLAYMQMETRTRLLIDLSIYNPGALNRILMEPVDSVHEVFRVNILTSLGVLSRHGLVNEVLTKQRIALVSQEYNRMKLQDRNETDGEST